MLRLRIQSVGLMDRVAEAMCSAGHYRQLCAPSGTGRWEGLALTRKIRGYNSALPTITFVRRGESGGSIVFASPAWLTAILLATRAFIYKGGMRDFLGLTVLAWTVCLFATSAFEVRRVTRLFVESSRRPDGAGSRVSEEGF